jgi:hypothetical protein
VSVIRVALPPLAGSVQIVPWRSMARRVASGDTATAIEVPCETVTVRVRGGFWEWTTTPSRNRPEPAAHTDNQRIDDSL